MTRPDTEKAKTAMPSLSERLRTAASLVTPGNVLADVGTDHAFVPVFLVLNGTVPSAVAMDVNRGPLERAREHIRMYALEDRIRTRLSDGLRELKPGEAQTVMIAGMGGALTERILAGDTGCPEMTRTGIKELVLQPQSELMRVRLFLQRSGWRIDKERMVFEDGKFYPMMQCHPGTMQLSEEELLYGPCLIARRDPVLIRYLGWQDRVLSSNLEQLEGAEGIRAARRREEISRKRERAGALKERMEKEC